MMTKYNDEVHVVHQDRVDHAKEMMIDDSVIQSLSDFFNAIKDPTRLKILHALFVHEMCVNDIAATLAMSQSAISHQLRLLRKTSLVKYEKKGKMVYYSLKDDHVHTIISQAIEHSYE